MKGYIQSAEFSGRTAQRKKVFGYYGSMMIATRPSGYHTKPHVHDCEQLNYMLEGDMWIFIEDRGFHLHEGDFLRVPANVVHWAWCTSDKDSTLFEWHSPPLIPATSRSGTDPLFDDDEEVKSIGIASNMPDNMHVDPEVYSSVKAERYVEIEKKKQQSKKPSSRNKK